MDQSPTIPVRNAFERTVFKSAGQYDKETNCKRIYEDSADCTKAENMDEECKKKID